MHSEHWFYRNYARYFAAWHAWKTLFIFAVYPKIMFYEFSIILNPPVFRLIDFAGPININRTHSRWQTVLILLREPVPLVIPTWISDLAGAFCFGLLGYGVPIKFEVEPEPFCCGAACSGFKKPSLHVFYVCTRPNRANTPITVSKRTSVTCQWMIIFESKF